METCDEIRKKCKRVFLESWLTNERFKSWIRKVPSDESFFHCTICNKNFSCSSQISKHEESAYHKNNIKNNNTSCNFNESAISKKSKKVFKKQWLEIEELKIWLREVSNNKNLFFCCICNKSFTAGLSKIYRHADSKIHVENLQKCNTESDTETLQMESEKSLPFEDRRKLAEIRYAALIADKNISYDTAQTILNFFQDLGGECFEKYEHGSNKMWAPYCKRCCPN